MAFIDGIKRQLRSVIEWSNPQEDELFYKWSQNGDEIKNASKLIVGPGQGCIFVYEGKIQAIIDSEKSYELETRNIPFWTTITKVLQSFESEHKVGLYFFKKTRIVDQKWGTLSDIKYDDPIYKFPVALRAFGNYSIRISDAEIFFKEVAGEVNTYTISSLKSLLMNRLIHPLSDYLAQKKLSYSAVDANRDEIAKDMIPVLNKDFAKLGFELTDFRIEGTTFDNDTLERINKIADVKADIHAAAAAGISYRELQQLDALSDAANNEAGAAGVFMGMGAGTSLAQNMNEPFTNQSQGQATTQSTLAQRLMTLKTLFSQNLITEDEYTNKKRSILEDL